MSIRDENMEKFYQAEKHNCSDIERLEHSSDEDLTIFIHDNKKGKHNSKYMKLKKTETKKHKIGNEGIYDGLKIKTKRKRRCCPFPTIAFCFCWLFLVIITFITLLKFTKPGFFPMMQQTHHQYTQASGKKSPNHELTIKSCDRFEVTSVWTSTYKYFSSESAVRFIDANQDGVDDVIIGFARLFEGADTERPHCGSLNQTYTCGGGAVAIDGRSGKELWMCNTESDIFAINCNADITNDGSPDCLLGGRVGSFIAVDGKTGKTIWSFEDQAMQDKRLNVYTPQFINDLDNDGIMDILQIQGGDYGQKPFSKTRLAGQILILSGKTGDVLRFVETPDGKESYFSPLVYTLKNGTDIVVFGTGGETHGGGLYVIQLHQLYQGKIKMAIKVHYDQFKGVMNPPVLLDLNEDGTVDMVIAFFNSTIAAIDGENLSTMWSYSVPGSETYSIPSPGYYNDDDTIDFLIKTNIGPGFPLYYHSMITVIDGHNGKPIEKPLQTSTATHDSPLSISMEGKRDLFLYWMADCLRNEGKSGKYGLTSDTVIDACKPRFNTKTISRFCLTNRATNEFCIPLLETDHDQLINELNILQNGQYEPSSKRGSRHIEMETPSDGLQLSQIIYGTGGLTASLQQQQQQHNGGLKDSIDIVVAAVWSQVAEDAINNSVIECIDDYNKKYGINVTSAIEQHKILYDINSPGFTHCTNHGSDEARWNITRSRQDAKVNAKKDDKDNAIMDAITDAIIDTKKAKGNPRRDTKRDAKKDGSSKMDIYRLGLKCVCSKLEKHEKCAEFLPIEKQRWAGYMGSLGNGFFNERN